MECIVGVVYAKAYKEIASNKIKQSPIPVHWSDCSLPHLRSLFARQHRAAIRYLVTLSYQDRERAEIVCTVNREAVVSFVQTKFPNEAVEVGAIPSLEKGLVLSDSRGKGALQT